MTSALAVLAHPDDESFGLGAVLSALVDAGTEVAGVCFTHGEASTLGAAGSDLHQTRAGELADAATALGIGDVELLDYPDGHLSNTPIAELADQVVDAARRHHADLLVVFDEGGITGHPDHQHATRAALAAAHRLDLPGARLGRPRDRSPPPSTPSSPPPSSAARPTRSTSPSPSTAPANSPPSPATAASPTPTRSCGAASS